VLAHAEELGIAGIVTITGHLPHTELLAVVASAEIVITPSHAEGFGLAAAEAMALRRPVVACGVGGLTEVVRDGESGLLVPPRSPVALAAAIGRLLDDPALKVRLGDGGRRRVEENFALTAIVDRLRGIYADVSSRQRTVPAAIS
jgi:glycosyltransferase involved in cell wall biosynthesis